MSTEFGPPIDVEAGSLDEARQLTASLVCIVGLGNPGTIYSGTPHNLGFAVVDALALRHGIPIKQKEGVALTGTGRIYNRPVLLVKPQTFMNNSGSGVSAILKSRMLNSRNLILVHDELDLPWTGLRIKKKGSAAGHNGVKSVIAALRSDYFTRVRVGIRPDRPIEDAAAFVLAQFAKDMKEDVSEMVSYTADAVETIVAEGALKAMAKYNRRARGLQEEEE